MPTGINGFTYFPDCKSDNAIRRTAVPETGVSHHHGDTIEAPPEATRLSQHYRVERFGGALNWTPIMQGDASWTINVGIFSLGAIYCLRFLLYLYNIYIYIYVHTIYFSHILFPLILETSLIARGDNICIYIYIYILLNYNKYNHDM